MSRRIDPAFQELLASVLLFWLPAHRDHGLSIKAARNRLEAALDAAAPVQSLWPSPCATLALAAQNSLDGQPGGIDKAAIEAATDARWHAAARYAWQDRRDLCDDEAAA
ncbi:MAG: hypothetical protein ACOYLS_01405 [Polymorphobacter sp.]